MPANARTRNTGGRSNVAGDRKCAGPISKTAPSPSWTMNSADCRPSERSPGYASWPPDMGRDGHQSNPQVRHVPASDPNRPRPTQLAARGATLGQVTLVQRLTTAVLAVIAALHVAWGAGSSFPFRDRDDLADAVVGSSTVPPAASCYAVAAALTVGALLVADATPLPRSLRRSLLLGMAGVLGSRGALGLAGATETISHGSNSDRFIRLDRRIYSPLCLCLSIGSLIARHQIRPPT